MFWFSITRQVWSWYECRLYILWCIYYTLISWPWPLTSFSRVCCLRYSQSMSFPLLHQPFVRKLWHISCLSITCTWRCDFDLLTSVLLRQLHVTWVILSMLGFIKLFPELRTGSSGGARHGLGGGAKPQKYHHETYRSRIRWWVVRNIRICSQKL